VFDVSDHLRSNGWQVPAYTMPENATEIAVLRVVVREGFSRDLAALLVENLRDAVKQLEAFPPAQPPSGGSFAH